MEEFEKEQEQEQKFTERLKFWKKWQKEPKGVDKNEPKICENPTFANFFKSLFRNFNRIISVNLLYVFGNFPLLFLLLAVSGYVSITSHAPYFQLFSAVKGASYLSSDPVTASLLGVFGLQANITVSTVWTKIMYGLSLLTLFTFGPVNVGATYLLRSVFRGDPIFFWSDFWYAIKKNIKQGMIFGVLDALIMVMLVYDTIYFNANMATSNIASLLFFLTIAMAVMYFFMRLYIYLMMITFDLKFTKLIKNAVSFAIIGIKRNLMALLGCACLGFIEFLFTGFFMPFAVIVPMVCLFGIGSYMGVYAAYPKIKEIMIDPYYKNHPEEMEEE